MDMNQDLLEKMLGERPTPTEQFEIPYWDQSGKIAFGISESNQFIVEGTTWSVHDPKSVEIYDVRGMD